VLLSGDHGRIDEWRLLRSVEITAERRPDLLEANPEIAARAEKILTKRKRKEKKDG
jgi:tRNA (guanine37-N1)-methyltransferase